MHLFPNLFFHVCVVVSLFLSYHNFCTPIWPNTWARYSLLMGRLNFEVVASHLGLLDEYEIAAFLLLLLPPSQWKKSCSQTFVLILSLIGSKCPSVVKTNLLSCGFLCRGFSKSNSRKRYFEVSDRKNDSCRSSATVLLSFENPSL